MATDKNKSAGAFLSEPIRGKPWSLLEILVYFADSFGNLSLSGDHSADGVFRRHGLSMKRWFYILLGGLGMGLMAAAVFVLCASSDLPPAISSTAFHIAEYIAVVVGLVMGVVGFIYGREAGELDIRQALKAGRRDHGVAGKEIDFECPICHKGYRASPMLAGKPFTCRECREVFDVPLSSAVFPALPAPQI